MKVEVNKRKTGKFMNTWKLNTPLNKKGMKEEIKGEMKNFLEMNESGNTKDLNLLDTAKAILRGKFIALNTYIKKQQRFEINNLTLHLKELEKEKKKLSPKLAEERN